MKKKIFTKIRLPNKKCRFAGNKKKLFMFFYAQLNVVEIKFTLRKVMFVDCTY